MRNEVEDGTLRKVRGRQEKRGEGRMTIDDVGDGEMSPTLKMKSKIKRFHTTNKANWSTIHKWTIKSDTAYQLLPGHHGSKKHH